MPRRLDGNEKLFAVGINRLAYASASNKRVGVQRAIVQERYFISDEDGSSIANSHILPLAHIRFTMLGGGVAGGGYFFKEEVFYSSAPCQSRLFVTRSD